ncbi:MAG: hypothetical protein M1132_12515 [Chloroflexi bacterium]|nr:hypothetical protein [Chloroflexota bacterium]
MSTLVFSFQLFRMIVTCTALNQPAPVATPVPSDGATSTSLVATMVPTAAEPTNAPASARLSPSVMATVAPPQEATPTNAPRIYSFPRLSS